MIPPRILAIVLGALPFAASAEVVARANGILLDHRLEENSKKGNALGTAKPDPAGDDLILFNNGDLMHGIFGGIDEGLLWKRNDINRPIKFGVPSIKQIIFNSARRLQLNEKSSFITLVSGDRIPGEIISLDDKNLCLKSPIVGDITISRNLVRSIAPNPFDGELHYIGPYSSDGWLTLEHLEKEEEAKEEKPSSWIHSGASFYSQSTTPLILADANLPDVGRISFNIAWKGRLSIALALHSDLVRVLPPEKEEEKDNDDEVAPEEECAPKKAEKEDREPAEAAPLVRKNIFDLRQGKAFQSIPWINPNQQTHPDLFGTGYTLSLQSGYPILTRNSFSKTGTSRQDRLSTARSNISLGESSEAKIEIRFDRKKSLIILYINGIYSNQWNDLSGYLGEGTTLGFLNRSSSSKIRISELIISSWGGSTDSVRSMEHPDRDIAILTNGTDRFSGKLTHISGGLAHLKTGYSKIQIPLQDLALINPSESDLLDLEADENEKRFEMQSDAVTVVYQPYGLIKLSPLSATAKTLNGQSPFLGKITINLDPAVLLNFSEDSPDLSDWFDDF